MTDQQRKEAIARAKAIISAMTKEELELMAKDPELAFHAMCATLAQTAA